MTQTERLRALLDSGRVRWMPGMLMIERATPGNALHRSGKSRITDGGWISYMGAGIPDLDDPATVGCLIAQLREAWGDPGLRVGANYDAPTGLWPWSVRGGKHHGAGFRVIGIHDTEAEAIIAAFEALP